MGPIRFDFAFPRCEGQVRPDPVLQLLGRHDVLASIDRLAEQAGAPELARPSSLPTEPRNWLRIRFFPPSSAPSLAEVASWCGATLAVGADAGRTIRDVAALDQAGPGDLTFLDNPRYLDALERTRAAAALVAPRYAGAAPSTCAALIVQEPYRAMALVMTQLYPERGQARFGVRRDRHFVCGVGSPFGAARTGRNRRSWRGDRPRRRDRRRHGHRPQCGHRSRGAHRPRRFRRRLDHDRRGADRRPGHHSSRRAHRAGRVRLRARGRAAISKCPRSGASSSRTTSRSAPE